MKKIRPKAEARQCIGTSMHELVEKDYRSILVILSLTRSQGTEGWTPIASAALNSNEARLCFDTKQGKKLKPNLSYHIHGAAKRGHKTVLELLLDMGADINEGSLAGKTGLLEAVYYDHLSCIKIFIEGERTLRYQLTEVIVCYIEQQGDRAMVR